MGWVGAWWRFPLKAGDCHQPAWVWTVLTWWGRTGHVCSRVSEHQWPTSLMSMVSTPQEKSVIALLGHSEQHSTEAWMTQKCGLCRLMHRVLWWCLGMQDSSRSCLLYGIRSTKVGVALPCDGWDEPPGVLLQGWGWVMQSWVVYGHCTCLLHHFSVWQR